jgi:L-lactate dehydrogenase complex protein LldE
MPGPRVGLFVTCLANTMRPRVGLATFELLTATGAEVVVPQTQTCCGQPGYNSGDPQSARALARKLVREFSDCDYLVLPSGSCAGMIRVHYPRLFASTAEEPEFARLAARTHELTDYLVNVARITTVPGKFHGTITYHDSCSGLRELGIKAQPRALIALLPHAQLVELPEAETCCGFGGAFAVKFDEISAHLAERKCRDIAATSASAIVAGDLGCLLHIEGRLRRRGDTRTRVLHIAELLAGDGA